MAQADDSPDDREGVVNQEVVRRLLAWHGAAGPPAGAMERAIEHLDRQREHAPRLTPPAVPSVARPRLLRYWPALAAAALVLVGIKALTWNGEPSADLARQVSPMIGSLVSGGTLRVVSFAVTLPREVPQEVRLVGDFNGWGTAGLPLERNPATGRWEGKIELPPGLHHYTYLVDGTRWVIDPGAPRAGDDLLGATNAIVVPDAR